MGTEVSAWYAPWVAEQFLKSLEHTTIVNDRDNRWLVVASAPDVSFYVLSDREMRGWVATATKELRAHSAYETDRVPLDWEETLSVLAYVCNKSYRENNAPLHKVVN